MVGATWAIVTPPMRTPDEPQHLNSIMRLVVVDWFGEPDGENPHLTSPWPAPMTARMVDGSYQVAIESGLTTQGRLFTSGERTVLPHRDEEVAAGYQRFTSADIPQAPDRSVIDWRGPWIIQDWQGKNESYEGVDYDDRVWRPESIDQMTQHPPLYYATLAVVGKALNVSEWDWGSLLISFRLATVLLTLPLVPMVADTARMLVARATRRRTELEGERTGSTTAVMGSTIGPPERAGIVAGLMVFMIPQASHILSGLTNDALLVSLAAATIWGVTRVMTGHGTRWTPIWTGLWLGLALLTKGFALALVPIVVVGMLVRSRRAPWDQATSQNRLKALIGAIATATIVGGWWWARNLLIYGTVQPGGMPLQHNLWSGEPNPDVSYFLSMGIGDLTTSFWAKFGWLEISISQLAAYILSGFVVALIVVALVIYPQNWREHLTLLILPLGIIVIVFKGSWDTYMVGGYISGMQGRYFFSALAVILSLCALALVKLVRRSWITNAALIVAVLAQLAGLTYAWRGFWWQPSEGLDFAVGRWRALTEGSTFTMVACVFAGALAVAWAAIEILRFSRYDKRHPIVR